MFWLTTEIWGTNVGGDLKPIKLGPGGPSCHSIDESKKSNHEGVGWNIRQV